MFADSDTAAANNTGHLSVFRSNGEVVLVDDYDPLHDVCDTTKQIIRFMTVKIGHVISISNL